MKPDKFKLLERYHDGQVSPEEAAAVESMLERDPEALDYLGSLDEMAELARMAVDESMAQVSFEGMWSRIETQIQAHDQAAQVAARPQAEPQRGGLLAWLKELFTEHKGAWITAGATAFAVALVMFAFGNQQPERVIERQIVVVDSVDQVDPNATVLVKHIEGDNTAIIWTLPQTKQAAPEEPEGEEDDNEGVEITDEPL